MRFLTAIPVYNEEKHLDEVVRATRSWSPEVLVVDDGSTDQTPALLGRHPGIHVIRHAKNEGYGVGLADAFRFAVDRKYDVLVTMDCDGQHEPKRIPELVAAIEAADIVSGSRYLTCFDLDSIAPEDRRRINVEITQLINRLLALRLTDAFCGFKAYRTEALARMRITEPGYGMPLELWVQAARLGLRIREVPVPLIYLDEERAFGGSLDDATRRLAYYREVIDRAMREADDLVAPPGRHPRAGARASRPRPRAHAGQAGHPKNKQHAGEAP